MRLGHIRISGFLLIRELLRRRIAMMLFFLVPSLFYAIVLLSTTERTMAFKLASVSGESIMKVSERSETFIFIGLAPSCYYPRLLP